MEKKKVVRKKKQVSFFELASPTEVVMEKRVSGIEIRRREDGHLDVGTYNADPSLTDQASAQETDVNYIISKFKKTGVIDHTNNATGVYADMTEIPDYRSALDKVIRAQAAFDDLPSSIRNRFGNDPGNLIEFLSDDKNREEAKKLGLIKNEQDEILQQSPKKVPDTPVKVEEPPK